MRNYTNLSKNTPVPQKMSCLNLYGAGMDSLKLETVDVPEPAANELLCRTDAVGVCASDYKLIIQGEKHTRVKGKDLKADPAVPGHEVALTVVRVGKALEGRYRIGGRYTIQADIYMEGVNKAYGYWFPGAFRPWQTVGPHIYDNGYLLPIPEGLGYSQAALAEPWACVYYAYEKHRPTKSVKPGGTAWYVGAGPLGMMHVEKGISDGAARTFVSEIDQARLERVERTLRPLAEQKAVELVLVNLKEQKMEDVLAPLSVDDVIILAPVPKLVEEAFPYLAKDGYMNVFAGFPNRDKAFVSINLNDMHYRNITLLATSGSPISALEKALKEAASGRINPNNAVAAVGGMKSAWKAIEAVHKGTYPGKIVIYPQLDDLPLTAVEELTEDGIWTKEAEARLLASSG